MNTAKMLSRRLAVKGGDRKDHSYRDKQGGAAFLFLKTLKRLYHIWRLREGTDERSRGIDKKGWGKKDTQ